jgi:energy-coupling factor transport system ATP-binding protein
MEEAIYADIRSLSFSEEGNQVLRDIQLSIGCGEFVVVTGGTGSGKSSLLNSITGAVPKHYGGFFDGTVRLMGVDTADIPLPKMSGICPVI